MKAKIWKAIQLVLILTGLGVTGFSSYKVVHYLRSSPRFEVKQLGISGLKRVEENQVKAQADVEIGTNVFALDLEELRQRVESLEWVRYAFVQRILPDKIAIKVIEREPVGLARISGYVYQFDVEAVVLEPDLIATSFPILDGLHANNRESNLRKVNIYLKVMEELQGKTELSEIHINDSEEVSVVSTSDPRLVVLGVGEFKARWVKYLQLKPEIQQRFPNAVRIDLRFRNQTIIDMNPGEVEEKVIWAAEKNSL